MPHMSLRLFLFCVAFAPFAVCSLGARASDLPIGVDLAQPQWETAQIQDAMLAQLVAADVKLVRLSLLKEGVTFIRRVNEKGIKILLTIPVDAGVMAHPGTQARPSDARGSVFALPPLSKIDPARFRGFVEPLFRLLDREGIQFAGIEVGNEINWAPFNGDFPFPGTALTLEREELDDDPLGRQVAAGYRVYMQLLTMVKSIRDASSVNRATPIMISGLTEPDKKYLEKGPFDFVTIEATLEYLREFGLDDVVDAYAVHVYPNLEMSSWRRKKTIRRLLSHCEARGDGLPCWITEWGVINTSATCPPDEQLRLAVIGETRKVFADYVTDRRVAGLIYFSWAYGPWGIYRCNGLTDAGRLALTPFD